MYDLDVVLRIDHRCNNLSVWWSGLDIQVDQKGEPPSQQAPFGSIDIHHCRPPFQSVIWCWDVHGLQAFHKREIFAVLVVCHATLFHWDSRNIRADALSLS